MPYPEKKLTSDFSAFLRKNKDAIPMSFACEFKVKKGKQKLDLIRDFQPQQLPSLRQAKHSCLYHKISDMSVGMKPFDSFQICLTPAFVGVLWYTPRKPKILYMIDIDNIDFVMKNKVKKITEEEAKNISTYIFKL